MNLIFHDRAAVAPEAGTPLLTIEASGNFIFSAGAALALKLAVGTRLALAEDADAAGRPWYLVLADEAVGLKPFELRTSGGKNGQRLLFSSAATAKKFFAAHPLPGTARRLQLTIGPRLVSGLQVGNLYPLRLEGAAPETVASGPRPALEYGFGRQAGPYPVEAIKLEDVVVTRERVAIAEATPAATGKRNVWSDDELATLRRLYPTTMAKDIAAQLGRPLMAVQQKAHDLLLKKGQAKGPRANAAKPPTAPKAGKGRPLGSGEDDINPVLAEKLNKTVQKLAPLKIFKMDAHEATQALKLLTSHTDKWDWVPGAAKLHERLSAVFSVAA